MRHALALSILAALLSGPATAQDAVPMPPAEPEAGATGEGPAEEGLSLLEEGAKLLLRGLAEEMEPAMRDLAGSLDGMMDDVGPMLRDLAVMMGDVRNYQAPVMLPNGDILIRRRPDSPLPRRAPGPEGAPPGESIDL